MGQIHQRSVLATMELTVDPRCHCRCNFLAQPSTGALASVIEPDLPPDIEEADRTELAEHSVGVVLAQRALFGSLRAATAPQEAEVGSAYNRNSYTASLAGHRPPCLARHVLDPGLGHQIWAQGIWI